MVLDVVVTPELEAEGLARDFVRLVQTARKAAELHVSDHIRLVADLPAGVAQAIGAHESYVKEQTLAEVFAVGPMEPDLRVETVKLGGESFSLGLRRV